MNYLKYLFVLLIFLSRKGQNKHDLVPLNKQLTYAIDITAPIPVIIYFNDIKISEENTPLNTTLDVNGYALKNDKYKIKIQIFPIFRRGDKMINPEDIKGCLLKFGSYVRDKEKNDILD